jgi:hypothetical protein
MGNLMSVFLMSVFLMSVFRQPADQACQSAISWSLGWSASAASGDVNGATIHPFPRSRSVASRICSAAISGPGELGSSSEPDTMCADFLTHGNGDAAKADMPLTR